MPFLSHERGPVYYQHWACAEPRAAVVFLHGFGEHTGLYHRYGFALNAAGIDMWAIDQFGHGLSPGDRGQLGSIAECSALAGALTDLAERESPGIPLLAQGHSWGAVVTLFRLLAKPGQYRAAVISGAPLAPIAEMLDLNSTMNLDVRGLSGDPFFLDCIENDPLGFSVADSRMLTRELDWAWDRFGTALPALTVPTLAVHGEIDPIAAPGAVRAYAEQIPALRYLEFPGCRHDVLNDIAHREVATEIASFVIEQTSTRT